MLQHFADPADAYVAIKDTITGTGDQAYTGAGFEPAVLILGQTMCTAVNTDTSQGNFSIGAGGPATLEQCLGIIDEDAQSTTDCESFANLTNIVHIKSAVGTTDTLASLTSLDADGWTLNYSDGSASARKMLAIAIGDSTTGGISGTISITLENFISSFTGTTTVTGTLNKTIDNVTSNIIGTIEIVGTISNIIDEFTSSISGSLGSSITGNINVTVQDNTSNIIGTTAIMGTVSVTIDVYESDILGTTTIVGTIAQQMQDYTSSIHGFIGDEDIQARLRTLLGMGT